MLHLTQVFQNIQVKNAKLFGIIAAAAPLG